MSLRSLWRRVVGWVRRIFLPSSSDGGYRVIHVAEEPDVLAANRLYLVGENGHLSHATLACPCGCNETISLDMLPGAEPGWTFDIEDGRPSLYPSVARIRGCRSHFFLRNGRIAWCGSGHRPRVPPSP